MAYSVAMVYTVDIYWNGLMVMDGLDGYPLDCHDYSSTCDVYKLATAFPSNVSTPIQYLFFTDLSLTLYSSANEMTIVWNLHLCHISISGCSLLILISCSLSSCIVFSLLQIGKLSMGGPVRRGFKTKATEADF